MFKNYMKISLRNISKNKVYSFINIFGLAVGMTCFALIVLFVKDELSFDKFHNDHEKLYRLNTHFKSPANEYNFATSIYASAPLLAEKYPEIEDVIKFFPATGTLVRYGEKNFYEDDFSYVSPNFFEKFNFKLISGDNLTALTEPKSLVITESSAEKYFGETDPIGKSIIINNGIDSLASYTITAIAEDCPGNTVIQYNFLANNSSVEVPRINHINNIQQLGFNFSFVVFSEDADVEEFNNKITEFLSESIAPAIAQQTGIVLTPYLQQLSKIHLDPDKDNDLNNIKDVRYIYIFSTIALFILILACINYMNLATARSAGRGREVGMRKVLGAFRFQLIKQFLGESIFVTLSALLLSLILIQVALPSFNSIADKTLELNYFTDFYFVLFLIGTSLVVGLVSGSYPAGFLSAFEPAKIFKGNVKSGSSGLRSMLVVIQFVISIVLIIGTGITVKQLDYFTSKDLGFDDDQIMVITINNGLQDTQIDAFKNELIQNPEIINAASSNFTPGENRAAAAIFELVGSVDNDRKTIQNNVVDFDFIDTYGFKFVAGRDFNREISSDSSQAMIVNEKLVEELEWDNPLGKQLIFVGNTSTPITVIGVVKDFHHFSLHRPIVPFIYFAGSQINSRISVKIQTGNVSETINYIQETWNKFAPGFPMTYTFVDDNFADAYEGQERFRSLFGYFAGLAVIIACMGLFGLASFSADQRTKEIGVRKVLGASNSSIIILLSKEFTKWVVVSNIIAWPMAFYVMDLWLSNFAYRADIGIMIYVSSGVIALVLALLTISYQALKTSMLDPVESLKYE